MTAAGAGPAGALPAVQPGLAADAGRAALEAALLAAHAADDRRALIGLYAGAADGSDGIAASFYLTQAYVFALEAGDPRAAVLKARLVAKGAEVPDAP